MRQRGHRQRREAEREAGPGGLTNGDESTSPASFSAATTLCVAPVPRHPSASRSLRHARIRVHVAISAQFRVCPVHVDWSMARQTFVRCKRSGHGFASSGG